MDRALHEEPKEATRAPNVADVPQALIRVLHVDDEADQLVFTKRFLEDADPSIHVESVSSPVEALRLLQEGAVDCVVSDYEMPGMDGVELARRVRETSGVPFVIYTGRGSEEVAARAFAAGVDDYLRKELDPAHYQVLAKQVRQAVEKHRTEELYRHILDESLDAIVILDGTRIVLANRAQADLYGVDGPGDLLGRDVTEWNTDPERVRRMALRRQGGEPEPSRYEYSIRREDGEVRHVETLVSLIDYRGRPASLAFNRDITEHKQMEEEIVSLARFPSENFSPVMRISEDGTILYANAASGSLLDEWRSEVGQAAPEQWRLWVSEALESGLGRDVEIQCEDRVVSFVLAPITDAGYVNAYGRDITERKQILEELTASEERWRSLIGLAPNGIISINLRGVITSANNAFLHRTGYSRDEVVGKHFSKLGTIRARDLPKYLKMFSSVIRGKIPPPLDYEYRHKDGSTRWAEGHFSIVKTGEEREILAILTEITERKRMEDKLRESLERLRNIFSASPYAITVSDLKGKIVECNQATLDVHGFSSKDEVIGRSVFEFIAERDYDRAMENTKKTMMQGAVKNVEYTLLTRDGREFPGELSASVISDIQGNPMGFVGITRDLSERKLAEERLLEYAEHLEDMAEEKTQELLDAERLVAAGRVAAMVGHDLRGPLQTISNAVYLLEKTPEKSDEMLKMIMGSVQRADQMLEELHSQTRETPLSLETVNLGELIQEAIRGTPIPSSVDVTPRIGDGLDEVSLDPLKMRRVLDNLVENALDAMPDGGVLTVTAERKENGVVISVADTGVGIPEEEVKGLFKPFHTTKQKGLGLGLAYCKSAVEAHGGIINVESEVGKGTNFAVKLPTKPHAK